jgi:hypothetical protein
MIGFARSVMPDGSTLSPRPGCWFPLLANTLFGWW